MHSTRLAMTRAWLAACVLPLGLGACATDAPKALPAPGGTYHVYVGTYTGPKSEGIYAFDFDTATGAATAPALAAKTESPSFLALRPDGKTLYAANELAGAPPAGGTLSAFRIADEKGALRFLNKEATNGDHPCHLAIDRTGKWAIAANYSSGSVAILPLKDDGSLGGPASVLAHKGSSANQARQKEPHAHCVTFDARERFAFVCDLGIDRVVAYRFDPAKGSLAAEGAGGATLAPGSGPRHAAFSADGRFLYVLSELSLTVAVFSYAADTGALAELQTISTLPGKVEEGYSAAEIALHPSGRFLYTSNRGNDSIAVFVVDKATGRLAALQHKPTGGKTPRSFALDPSGSFLLAANQGSDTITVFRVDWRTGTLAAMDNVIKVPSPVCVLFGGISER
jgi:6-phosphogluconolactonase